MGLLDNLFDPQDPASAARLSAAFSLLGQQGFGNAGMAGLQAAQQFRQQQAQRERMKLQDQLLQGQLGQLQREQEIAALPQQFLKPGQLPATMDNRDVGQPGEQNIPQAFDTQGYIQALMGKSPMQALQFQAAIQKDNTPIKLGANERLLSPDGQREIVPAMPDPGKQSSIGQLIAEMNALPPNDPRRAIYQQAIQKASTHQPAVSVSYGQPVAGVDATGNPVFFQPAKGGGAPAIVPGVKPAPQNRDTKLPAELQRMQIAGDAMGNLLNDYEKLLEKNNPRDPMVQANPAIRADMQSLKRNLELQFKELQALGALAGPDIEIMRQALSDPFSLQGAYYGRDGLKAQIRQARTLLKNRSDAVMRSQGKPDAAPKAEDNDPLGIRK